MVTDSVSGAYAYAVSEPGVPVTFVKSLKTKDNL